MSQSEDAAGYRHREDACLDRTARGLDFGAGTTTERATAAERQVDPLRGILGGLLRSITPGRG